MSSKNKQYLSYLICFAVYAMILDWKIALLLMVGVGFHECCHLWAARYCKLQTNGFYLIPFLGGVALITERYRKYSDQAITVLAGPMGGGLMAAVVAGLYLATGSTSVFWGAAAYWLTLLNLFNLFPLSSMDGGQVLGTITYSINDTLGLVVKAISNLVAIVVLWFFNPFLVGLVVLFGGSEVYSEYKNWKYTREGKMWLVSESYQNRPKKLTKLQIVAVAGTYLTSMILLGLLLLVLREHSHGIADLIKK